MFKFLNVVVRSTVFLKSATLICQGTDISEVFKRDPWNSR